jgi:uncharacterized protein YecE (DUF72 family)
LPKTSTVIHWAAEVPKGFLFCPKMSRWITHAKKLNDPAEILPPFFDCFSVIRRQLGPVLIQLPPNLGFHSEKAEAFFAALRKYKGFSFALEPRHSSWMENGAIRLLKNYKIAFVIAESGNRFASGEFVTAQHIYLRFHGPDGYYGTSYPDKTLKTWARKCVDWQAAGHTVWAFFNNDGQGYALGNARRLAALVAS